jgi:catalase
MARPGNVGIATRRIAILVAEGTDGAAAMALHEALASSGAVPRFVGVQLGRVSTVDGDPLDVEISMETAPSVLWDGIVVPGGPAAVQALSMRGHAIEFLKDQYRHCKPMLLIGDARDLLAKAGIPPALPDGAPDPGLLLAGSDDPSAAAAAFAEALARHRHFERETDPPVI